MSVIIMITVQPWFTLFKLQKCVSYYFITKAVIHLIVVNVFINVCCGYGFQNIVQQRIGEKQGVHFIIILALHVSEDRSVMNTLSIIFNRFFVTSWTIIGMFLFIKVDQHCIFIKWYIKPLRCLFDQCLLLNLRINEKGQSYIPLASWKSICQLVRLISTQELFFNLWLDIFCACFPQIPSFPQIPGLP